MPVIDHTAGLARLARPISLRGRADAAERGDARRLADAGEQQAAVVGDLEVLDAGEERPYELPRAPTRHARHRPVAIVAAVEARRQGWWAWDAGGGHGQEEPHA